MILKGQNVILKMGGVAIAAAKSCSVDVDVDMIKVSSPTDGAWEHSIAGRKSWKASCSHLVTQISDSVAMVGQSVTLLFQPVDDSGTALSNVSALQGTAIVKSWKGTFTIFNLAQGTLYALAIISPCNAEDKTTLHSSTSSINPSISS